MNPKRRVLDHIIYEFQMYLYTYKKITAQKIIFTWKDQLDNNSIWISHCNSLRNIIRFFMSNSNFKDDYFYSRFKFSRNKYASSEYKMNKNTMKSVNKKLEIIDKSICHLTEKRFDFKKKSLDDKTEKLIIESFPKVKKFILKFLQFLSNEDNKNIMYYGNKIKPVNISKELKLKEIVGRIELVKELLK